MSAEETDSTSENAPAELVLTEEGIRYKLKKEVTQIGRLPKCDIPLDDHRVSRVHAEVKRASKGYLLMDLSHNGSRVNGLKVKRALLQDGDELMIGKTLLTFYHRSQTKARSIPPEERKVGKDLGLLKDLYDEVAED
ncbi:MAG: FHA domain-containing protein [Planctomycetota bacterium]|nr:FHA domain-containing protein [Planctomycetota bacterium]MDA1139202.1 FHA domain-containing protein [Planctomycetota bacterium]